MDPKTAQILLGAAGAAGGGAGLYVDDVFSTHLYDGTDAAQTITNGIDLSGEGGMVWTKDRSASAKNHMIFDTERGVHKRIFPNTTDAESDASSTLTAFNSNGFSIGTNSTFNTLNNNICSWTFRKAPGFFDVVTYTGNGAVRTISHSLGSAPGMVWVKRLDSTGPWICYHRSLGSGKNIELQKQDAQDTNSAIWNDTDPTSSNFTLGTNANVNGSGRTFVAYVFAHDDQSFGDNGNESIISCGEFTATSSTDVNVNLGWEAGWILWRRYDGSSSWYIEDIMRGMHQGTGNTTYLQAENGDSEGSYTNTIGTKPTPTGFIAGNSYGGDTNNKYLYMAIRRPNKPPEAGTDVFALDTQNSGSYSVAPYYRGNIVVDMALRIHRSGGFSSYPWFASRLMGGDNLITSSSNAQSTAATVNAFDFMNGWGESAVSGSTTNLISPMFRRAPGFFDVVAYTGTGANRSLSHSLNAVPELIILKSRSATNDWFVYSEPTGNGNQVRLNSSAASEVTSRWQSTTPTSTQFYINGSSLTNASGSTYIALLFATLDGISKVGSYTGTGSNIDVNCGFTAGARFVLIKRTDATGDWLVFDTLRGIVSGNDPHFTLNGTSAEVTDTDYIDPLNSGFTVTSSAPAALNTSGGTYLFLAIA